MRDGVELFTAIYRPKDRSRSYPILMRRTPYAVKPYGADAYPASLGPSEAMMRDGIAMFERLRSPRVITGLRRLGLAQHRRGDSAGALASFERGLAT